MHCHDWATAPVAFGDPQAAPVFTIHNLNYGADLIGRAVAASAVATTVSPTYAAEARALGRFRSLAQGTPADLMFSGQFLPGAAPGLPACLCTCPCRASVSSSADHPVDMQLVQLHRQGILAAAVAMEG